MQMERGVDRWVMGNFSVQIRQMWGVTGMVAGMAVQVSPQKRWLSGQLAVQEWHVMRETWCGGLVCELRGNSDETLPSQKSIIISITTYSKHSEVNCIPP